MTICIKRTDQNPSVTAANTGMFGPCGQILEFSHFSAEGLEFQPTGLVPNDWEHFVRLFRGKLPADRFDRSSKNLAITRSLQLCHGCINSSNFPLCKSSFKYVTEGDFAPTENRSPGVELCAIQPMRRPPTRISSPVRKRIWLALLIAKSRKQKFFRELTSFLANYSKSSR